MAGKKTLLNAEGEYQRLEGQGPGAGGGAKCDEQELDSKRHDRSYNPADDAERGSVSEKLNGDSGRYRKGPGPL